MSIWAKIAKYGGSTLKGMGSYAKQGLKSAGNATIHPTQALRSTGSAMKTAAVGSAAGYVAWQNLVNDKSMVEIASDVVVGKDTTEKISEAMEDVKGLPLGFYQFKETKAIEEQGWRRRGCGERCHGRHQQQVERHEQLLPWHLWRQRTGDVRQLLQELRERQRVGTEPCRTGDSSVSHLRTFWVAWQDSRSHARHDAHRQQLQHQEHRQW